MFYYLDSSTSSSIIVKLFIRHKDRSSLTHYHLSLALRNTINYMTHPGHVHGERRRHRCEPLPLAEITKVIKYRMLVYHSTDNDWQRHLEMFYPRVFCSNCHFPPASDRFYYRTRCKLTSCGWD